MSQWFWSLLGWGCPTTSNLFIEVYPLHWWTMCRWWRWICMFQKRCGSEEKSWLVFILCKWSMDLYYRVIFVGGFKKQKLLWINILINSPTVPFEILWVDPSLPLNFEHPSQVARDSRTLLDNVFVCCTWNSQMWDLCWRFYKKDLRTYGCDMSESSTHANETPFRYEAFMMPVNPLNELRAWVGKGSFHVRHRLTCSERSGADFAIHRVMPVPKNAGTPSIMIVWNVTGDWTCREEYIEKINEMPEFDTSMILEYKDFRGRSKSCETSMGFEHWNDVLVEFNSRYLSGSIDFIQHFKSTTSLGWKIFLPVDLLFGRRLRMILCGNWWP